MMNGNILKSKDYEVFELSNGDCYIKSNNQYFFKKSYFASKRYQFHTTCKVKWQLFDYICILLTIISVILLGILFLNSSTFFDGNIKKVSAMYISIFFLVFNVIFHEIGHALFLKIWHRKIGKIKINFRYIFPMITVDTSDGYLLPKFRRCCVSYAGAMVNIYSCFIVYVFFNDYTFVIPQVLTMITFCLIPIGGIRNDGYHIVFSTILNINNTGKKKTFVDYVGTVIIYSAVIYSLYANLFS